MSYWIGFAMIAIPALAMIGGATYEFAKEHGWWAVVAMYGIVAWVWAATYLMHQ